MREDPNLPVIPGLMGLHALVGSTAADLGALAGRLDEKLPADTVDAILNMHIVHGINLYETLSVDLLTAAMLAYVDRRRELLAQAGEAGRA